MIILLALSVSSFAYYAQCDKQWKDVKIGLSTSTICNAGGLLCSAAMMLDEYGIKLDSKDPTPTELNKWLLENNGYGANNVVNLVATQPFGINVLGHWEATGDIKQHLDKTAGKLCVLNVNNGKHWVLTTGYYSGGFNIKDPADPLKTKLTDQEANGGGYCVQRVQASA